MKYSDLYHLHTGVLAGKNDYRHQKLPQMKNPEQYSSGLIQCYAVLQYAYEIFYCKLLSKFKIFLYNL